MPPACWAFRKVPRAASDWTRWCSAWCKPRSGKSTRSTSRPAPVAQHTMNKLGKYQIRRTLGKGAMGIVYEGFDPVIERTVAIKTILPSQLKGAEIDPLMVRFKREAQAAGRLNHPGIVGIYDYGEEIAQDI